MEAQEDIETIFTNPDFLATVRELLLTRKEAPPEEMGEAIEKNYETEVERRVRFMINLRMKKAYTKSKRVE